MKPGSSAKLISKEFFPTSSCYTLKFKYNMNGKGMGTLRVYKKERQVFLKDNTDITFERSGDQGSNWHEAYVEVDTDAYTFTSVVFEAVKGQNNNSEIAIDDIELLDYCPSRSTSQATTTVSTAWTSKPMVKTTTDAVEQLTSSTSIVINGTTDAPLVTNGINATVSSERTACSNKSIKLELGRSQKIQMQRIDKMIRNFSCEWEFQAEPSNGILGLTFEEFDFPPRINGTCEAFVKIESSSAAGFAMSRILCDDDGMLPGKIFVDNAATITLRLVIGGTFAKQVYTGFVAEVVANTSSK